jgi:2-dehydropantoate 2-reductase
VRTILLGAGAIGGTVGALLSRAGSDVALVARGPHLAALRTAGLTLRTPAFTETVPVHAIAGPEEIELTADDRLVLTVKTQDSASLLDAWSVRRVRGGGVAGERLPIFCFQNGVENERLALRRFARVYAACVWMPTSHLEPGRVDAHGTPFAGMLHLGRYGSGDAVDAACTSFVAELTASGILAHAAPDVMRWKYAKLVSNLANAVEALTRAGDDTKALVHELTAEAYAVLAAAKIEHATKAEERAARGHQVDIGTIPGAPRGGGSTWQSLARGSAQLEGDFLNGEIALLGRLHGVPSPLNTGLQRLAAQAAREHWPPGHLEIAEVRRRLVAAGAGVPG